MEKTGQLEKWIVAGQKKRMAMIKKAQEEERRAKETIALNAEFELTLRNILEGNKIKLELMLNKQTGNWELTNGSAGVVETDPRNLIPELIKMLGAEVPYPRVEQVYIGEPPPPAPAIPRDPPDHDGPRFGITT